MSNSSKKNLTYISGNSVNLYRRDKSYTSSLPNSLINRVFPPRREFGRDLTNIQTKPLDADTDRRHYWFPPNFIQ